MWKLYTFWMVQTPSLTVVGHSSVLLCYWTKSEERKIREVSEGEGEEIKTMIMQWCIAEIIASMSEYSQQKNPSEQSMDHIGVQCILHSILTSRLCLDTVLKLYHHAEAEHQLFYAWRSNFGLSCSLLWSIEEWGILHVVCRLLSNCHYRNWTVGDTDDNSHARQRSNSQCLPGIGSQQSHRNTTQLVTGMIWGAHQPIPNRKKKKE